MNPIITTTVTGAEITYMGGHRWVPGLQSSEANQAIVIGEATYKELLGQNAVDSYTSNRWFFELCDETQKDCKDALKTLGVEVSNGVGVASSSNWGTNHEANERTGGLIFGTPGLLSLQFVVASLASIASAFVFLSLVLSQRKKELAILQAIGASPQQVMRLVLFEIMAILLVSMGLGVILGLAISEAFNGFFGVFGFIFQIFLGQSAPIDRDLVWPWTELILVNASVLVAVVIALLFTTRRALKSDLAIVLKGSNRMDESLVILEAKNMYHIYESLSLEGNVVALRGLNVRINEGEAVAVIGPSGSGKSTLLKCLGGLMKPSSGSVSLGGKEMIRMTGNELVKLRQETVSFIFQDSNLLPDLNALDNVAQPLRHQGVMPGPARAKAMELLEKLAMGDRWMGMPEQLSGGEQQRVAIARALITNPKLILADEPTGALDPITSREVLELFEKLHEEENVAFLLVTHNRDVAYF